MGTAAWYELMQGLEYLGDMLDKMWAILTTSPQTFKGGTIWSIISTINGVLGAIDFLKLIVLSTFILYLCFLSMCPHSTKIVPFVNTF